MSVFARIGRLITVVVLTGATCLLATGTGWAGGPTSALLVAPGVERATAVYYSDPEYEQLQTLLAEPAVSSAPSTPPADGSGYITVSWLVHDVSIWRIDRIFLAKNGEHLIVTQLMDASTGGAEGMYPGQLGADSAIRHRTADPAALQALMDRLGLTGVATGGTSTVALPADVARPGAADLATAESLNPAAAAWWIFAGLVLGAGAAALAVRYLPAVRRRFFVEPDDPSGEPIRMVRLPL